MRVSDWSSDVCSSALRFRLTLEALGGTQPDTHTVLTQRREAAAAEIRLMGLRDESRDAFWRELDVAYFLRHEASEIAWHTRHLYYQIAATEPVVRVRVLGGSEEHTSDLPSLMRISYAVFCLQIKKTTT